MENVERVVNNNLHKKAPIRCWKGLDKHIVILQALSNLLSAFFKAVEIALNLYELPQTNILELFRDSEI